MLGHTTFTYLPSASVSFEVLVDVLEVALQLTVGFLDLEAILAIAVQLGSNCIEARNIVADLLLVGGK